ARRRRALVEVLRLCESLCGQARTDDLSVLLDEPAVRLARERELREAREEDRDRQAEDERQHDDGDERGLQIAHQCASPSTIGPSVKAGKTMRPAVRRITPTSSTTNVGPSVRKVPAQTGATFLPASEPPSASAASRGAKRPRSMATAPNDAEKFVAP